MGNDIPENNRRRSGSWDEYTVALNTANGNFNWLCYGAELLAPKMDLQCKCLYEPRCLLQAALPTSSPIWVLLLGVESMPGI